MLQQVSCIIKHIFFPAIGPRIIIFFVCLVYFFAVTVSFLFNFFYNLTFLVQSLAAQPQDVYCYGGVINSSWQVNTCTPKNQYECEKRI